MNLYNQRNVDFEIQNTEFLTEKILNFKQAAEFLGISSSALYKITHKRAITFYKPSGKLIYFKKSELIKWLLSNEQKSQVDFTEEYFESLKYKKNGRRN